MKLTDVLTRDEIDRYTERSDLKATGAVIFNWAFIAAIFYGVALWPNPLTILVGVALLGGRATEESTSILHCLFGCFKCTPDVLPQGSLERTNTDNPSQLSHHLW